MSVILDALRRRTQPSRGGAANTPQADSVLATLGYHVRADRGWSLRMVLTVGAVALLLGFIGVAVPVYLLSPRSEVQEDIASQDAPSRDMAQQAPTAVRATPAPEVPRPSSAELAPAPPRTEPTEPATQATARAPSTTPSVPVTGPFQRVETRAVGSEGPGRRAAPADSTAAQPQAIRSREVQFQPPSEPAEVDRTGSKPPPDHFSLALYYHRAGDFTNALEQYQLALERNDASAEVYNNLGLLYQERGDMGQAVEHFRRAITIDPRHLSAQNNLGVIYLREGRLADAAAQFAIALGIDDRSVESLVNLALVHQDGGRPVEARTLLQRAVDIAPRHPESHYNLAVVADEAGDLVTAAAHYRAFLRFGAVGHPELAPSVRARLTEIGTQ